MVVLMCLMKNSGVDVELLSGRDVKEKELLEED
jgi:hypothetical protein